MIHGMGWSLLLGVVLCCVHSHAKLFLKLQSSLTQAEVDASLAAQLALTGSSRISMIEDSVQPTYASLQQDKSDRLSHQAVRYVLHRFFVQQHGWYLKGLEPLGDTFRVGAASPQSSSAVANATDWVPSYLQDRIERRVGENGIDLREIAILAATLEDLVRKDAEIRLRDVYEVLALPTTGAISHRQAEEVVDTYFMIYLLNRNITLNNAQDAEWRRDRFARKYKAYDEAKAWITDLKHRHFVDEASPVDFALIMQIVQDIGEQYGAFNDLECKDLKKTLMNMEGPSRRSARVRLSDYYNHSFHTHWKFTEKQEFLRDNGVLDESDEKQPAIIVPNYVSSYPNCLKATTLYSVCCRNECEDLMKHLERKIGSPTATVDDVVALITGLSSDTIVAPRTLSEALLRRLQQMSDVHGGKVALHGRLFAQWMHHVFPHECPYPHEAGSTNPQTADDWMKSTGQVGIHVDEAVRRKIVEDACTVDSTAEEQELPWTEAEELLIVQPPPPMPVWLFPSMLLAPCAMVSIILLTLGSSRFFTARSQSLSLKEKQVLVLCGVMVIAYIMDLFDKALFIFALFGALISYLVSRAWAAADEKAKAAAFEAKCYV